MPTKHSTADKLLRHAEAAKLAAIKGGPPKPPVDGMEARIKAKIAEVTLARDAARQQLNGLENQLYVLDQLMNPPPEPEPLPKAAEAHEEAPPQGVSMPDGTV